MGIATWKMFLKVDLKKTLEEASKSKRVVNLHQMKITKNNTNCDLQSNPVGLSHQRE